MFTSTRSDILDIIKADIELPPGVILFEDPPVHTMHRGLMSRVFTPRRMAALEDQVRQYCASCLDPLVGSDGFDIITELGSMLPMRVIGMLLGIPEQDQVAVRDKTDANLRTEAGEPMVVKEDQVASGDMFADYIEWRAKHPSDDLMTTLLNAEFEDEHGVTRTLTRHEVLTYTAVLAGAGNETTGRLIGWLAKLLAEHPDQRRQIVEDRSLIPRVIDETLRFEPTGHSIARCITQDVEYHGPPSRPAAPCCCRWHRPTATHAATRTPTSTTSTARTSSTSPSGSACTSASARASPGSKARSPSTSSSNRFPEWDVDYSGMELAPTTTVRGWEHMPIVLT